MTNERHSVEAGSVHMIVDPAKAGSAAEAPAPRYLEEGLGGFPSFRVGRPKLPVAVSFSREFIENEYAPSAASAG